uniref:Uncharacterized protein n=1 Tax=Coccidioides posadasii RMSCC 3488 TaxID=454284 RepID=A0A0J6FK29_COCPO|nr:hypothetical protein CPAG_06079 [Coccidioides posadasii RMSCC 3488]
MFDGSRRIIPSFKAFAREMDILQGESNGNSSKLRFGEHSRVQETCGSESTLLKNRLMKSGYFTLEFNAEIEANKRHRKRRRDDSPPPDEASDGRTTVSPDSELCLRHTTMVRSSGTCLPDHQNYLQEPEGGSRSPTSVAEARNTQVSGTQLVAGKQAQNKREIQYMFSKSPADLAALLGDLLSDAMRASNQWASERRTGESTTECLTVLIPEGVEEDISITLWAGRRQAARIIELFRMQRTWSPSPNHVSPPPHAQQELEMSDPS